MIPQRKVIHRQRCKQTIRAYTTDIVLVCERAHNRIAKAHIIVPYRPRKDLSPFTVRILIKILACGRSIVIADNLFHQIFFQKALLVNIIGIIQPCSRIVPIFCPQGVFKCLPDAGNICHLRPIRILGPLHCHWLSIPGNKKTGAFIDTGRPFYFQQITAGNIVRAYLCIIASVSNIII